MKSTNYYNTFIAVAEDCPVAQAEVPKQKGDGKSAAALQYEMVKNNPYKFTSDDVFFGVFAVKKEVTQQQLEEERQKFFSKGQPCFRASPLTKRYGWGIHSNADGKVAVYAVESDEYRQMAEDKSLKQLKAMRNKKA